MSKSVLITGITGFLGSYIADLFLQKGYHVIGLKRSTSDTWRNKEYRDVIHWVDVDSLDWKHHIIELKPSYIIHGAWEGVTSSTRNSISTQIKNLELLAVLLEISKLIGVSKFLSLGSQAEYGNLNSIVSEETVAMPTNEYGFAKVLAQQLLESFCTLNNIRWYWMRVFSVFGEKEGEQWLIPSVINKVLSGEKKISLSPCTQKYAYLYCHDFAKAIFMVLDNDTMSGVYNLSGQNADSLRNILEKILVALKSDDVFLDFGALPLRENQSTLIEGAMDKYVKNVGTIEYTPFEQALYNTVSYYQNIHNE